MKILGYSAIDPNGTKTKQITFTCDNPECGKEAKQPPCYYNRSKKHYCSRACLYSVLRSQSCNRRLDGKNREQRWLGLQERQAYIFKSELLPDFMVILPDGSIKFYEIKSKFHRAVNLTPSQKLTIRRLELAGIETEVIKI